MTDTLTTARATVADARANLDAANAVLADAMSAYDNAAAVERNLRNDARQQAVIDAPKDGYYHTDGYGQHRYHRADYILPLGVGYAKVNVLDPDSFPFDGRGWVANGTVYIMSKPERTRPTRAFISSGLSTDQGDWAIGNVWECRHDQTGANLGTYTVVGIVQYGTDGQVIRTEGEVPTTKLSASVFK